MPHLSAWPLAAQSGLLAATSRTPLIARTVNAPDRLAGEGDGHQPSVQSCFRALKRLLTTLLWACTLGLTFAWASGQGGIEVLSTGLERGDDGLFLSSQMRIELPSNVEDALAKGIPIHFVATTELKRERWYWYDQRLAQSARYFRLTYMPLLRRWRVQTSASPVSSGSSGSALGQDFDTLREALASVQRISRWRVAPASDLEAGAFFYLEYQFRLDVSQLPRPIQIGALGQSDWNLAVQRNLRVPEGR